jgi:RHS repeat-associated protein
VSDTYNYDAFGLLLEQTGTTENHYLYRGEQFDEELGFYYLRARYMDPNVGRFVTMDSFSGFSSDPYSLHKYLYAHANPITNSDPSGNFIISMTAITSMYQGLLRRHNEAMLIPKYRMMRGAIFGAVDMMVENWLMGQDILDWNVLIGAAVGGAVSGVAPGIQYLNNHASKKLVYYLCKLKWLIPLVSGYGLKKDIEGVWEAINMEDYDLAIYRAAKTLHSLYEMRNIWRSFACFTEETLVYTKKGYRPIKDIKVADEVYSENAETGEQGFKRVKRVFARETTVLIHVFLGDIEIKTTPEHPFYVPVKGWVTAEELYVGEHVKLSSKEPREITFIQREFLTEPITVYNFEVEGWHTYFVSKNAVLVHNGCDPNKPIPDASRLTDTEQATAGRLMQQEGLTLYESDHLGAEYIDQFGRSYDALGTPEASQYWNQSQFFESIKHHLRKVNDFTVIDLTGFAEAHKNAVRNFVNSLPAAQQDKIIKIAF